MQRFAAVGKRPCPGCWNFLRAHQFFCENFGRLNACCRFRRTKRAQFFSGKKIDNPRGKGIVRTDHRQIDTIFLGELNEGFQITGGNRDIVGNFVGARVSWRTKNALHLRRLPQLPRKRMFTAATANNQNLHYKFI